MNLACDVVAQLDHHLRTNGYVRASTSKRQPKHVIYARDGDWVVCLAPLAIVDSDPTTRTRKLEAQMKALLASLKQARAMTRGTIRLAVFVRKGPGALPLPDWFEEACRDLGIRIVPISFDRDSDHLEGLF